VKTVRGFHEVRLGSGEECKLCGIWATAMRVHGLERYLSFDPLFDHFVRVSPMQVALLSTYPRPEPFITIAWIN
jgi:hypothetical protein